MSVIEFSTIANKWANKSLQQTIANVLIAGTVLFIAFQLSKITWQLLSPTSQATIISGSSVGGAKKNNQQQSINIQSLLSLNLFGQYSTTQTTPVISQAVQEAPETRLNLTLTGVVASNNEDDGAAIIAQNNQQETYGIGETIKGTRAVLDKVFHDRVIIKLSGRYETLMLDGFKYKKMSATNQQSNTTAVNNQVVDSPKPAQKNQQLDLRRNNELASSAKSMRQDISNDPGKISDYLRISPVRDAGKMKGYRLSPGKNKTFFQQSGLKFGDVAIALNGLDLSDAAQAMQALKTLREEQEITLTIDRKGDISDILFSIAN